MQISINPNLTEQQLKDFGFTDYDPPYWYYCRKLSNNITFNITILKFEPSAFIIELIDEDFLQPYIGKNKKLMKEYIDIIQELVDANIFVLNNL